MRCSRIYLYLSIAISCLRKTSIDFSDKSSEHSFSLNFSFVHFAAKSLYSLSSLVLLSSFCSLFLFFVSHSHYLFLLFVSLSTSFLTSCIIRSPCISPSDKSSKCGDLNHSSSCSTLASAVPSFGFFFNLRKA